MKKVLIGVGVVVAILAIVVYVAFSSLDSIIKTAVEKYGSEITQTKVTLNEVEISVQSGKGALRGFTLGNPKGFDTPSAMRFGEVSVTVDPSTVTSDIIVIKEVRISGPEVTYELASGGSNFDAIKRNVDAYTGAGAKKPAKEEKEAKKDGPKLIIENLYITGGKVGVSASMLKGKSLGGTLPNIHLKDIGKEKKQEKGATPGEVAKKVMDAISQGAAKAVAALNVESLTESLKGLSGGALETLKKGTGGGNPDDVKKDLEGAGDALKGLFGK